jgi:hypothetical protein
MSDQTSDARSSRGDGRVRTETRVKERVKVRRRRTRKEQASALNAEGWLAGSRSRRLRKLTLGSGAVLLLMIALYFIFRQ